MKTKSTIGKLIASALLRIGAFEFNSEKPFLLANGTYSPCYCDPRKLNVSYENRMLVADGLFEILIRGDYFLRPNYIGLTPTAAMPHGVTLAKRIGKPLSVSLDDKLFVLKWPQEECSELQAGENIVMATAPWAIVPGVLMANKHKLPFAYIRPEKKDHGKGKRIEGIIHKGQKAFVSYIETDSFEAGIQMVLFKEEILLKGRETFSLEDMRERISYGLHGKTVLIIEELTSTGGSALKQVKAYRDAGAEVLGVVTIFDYNLQISKNQYSEAKCPLFSLLDFDTFIEVIKEQKKFSVEQIATIEEWHSAPLDWGRNHGHVVEEKEKV